MVDYTLMWILMLLQNQLGFAIGKALEDIGNFPSHLSIIVKQTPFAKSL